MKLFRLTALIMTQSNNEKRGHGYGSIAIDESPDDMIAAPAVDDSYAGVPRERATSILFLFMVTGIGAFLLSFGLASDRQSGDEASMQTAELLASSSKHHSAAKPDKEHWYEDQIVDHFSDGKKTETWSHRYYESKKHWGGPGSPIFLVLGGEGPAERLFYPFIQDHLAKSFNAYVLQPEHRFYGESQPIKIKHDNDYVGLLTPEQAMADYLRLLKHKQKKLGCSSDRSSKHYCPVISVGGSYPVSTSSCSV